VLSLQRQQQQQHCNMDVRLLLCRPAQLSLAFLDSVRACQAALHTWQHQRHTCNITFVVAEPDHVVPAYALPPVGRCWCWAMMHMLLSLHTAVALCCIVLHCVALCRPAGPLAKTLAHCTATPYCAPALASSYLVCCIQWNYRQGHVAAPHHSCAGGVPVYIPLQDSNKTDLNGSWKPGKSKLRTFNAKLDQEKPAQTIAYRQ
jgi:hypothetical protein